VRKLKMHAVNWLLTIIGQVKTVLLLTNNG
jgi:hypothetical protein